MRTVKTYKEEILEKYKREKGGEMSSYLAKPTRSQIREACIWLLDKRDEKNDELILNRFFRFKQGENKLEVIQKFDADKFRPIVNFLIEETKTTSDKNLELISWLIDFKPRPYFIYLNSEVVPKGGTTSNSGGKEDPPPQPPRTKPPIKGYIKITMGIVLSLFLMIYINSQIKRGEDKINTNGKCMAWVETSYKEISCDLEFHPDSGAKTELYNAKRFKSFKKVEVSASYDFFIDNNTKKPRIWYYKNHNDEMEYFTYSGVHPTNGETLKKITPHIIDRYVPKHIYKPNSFIDTNTENKE